jgi:hypothetical protein
LSRTAFFSEEKNQKTFIPAPVERSRPWAANGEQRQIADVLLVGDTEITPASARYRRIHKELLS